MFVQNVDLAYAPCSFVDQAPCLTADFVTWLKKNMRDVDPRIGKAAGFLGLH